MKSYIQNSELIFHAFLKSHPNRYFNVVFVLKKTKSRKLCIYSSLTEFIIQFHS